MTYQEYVETKRNEYSQNPTYIPLYKVCEGREMMYDTDRKHVNAMNSGHYFYNDEGQIVDISQAAWDIGYVKLFSSYNSIEDRIAHGGRLSTGEALTYED